MLYQRIAPNKHELLSRCPTLHRTQLNADFCENCVGTNLATHASKLLCDNAPNDDSLLALCASSSSELPTVVESAVDYLICSDPSCLEPPPHAALNAEPPLPPHLAYIQNARMHGLTDENFISAQDRAIAINALFAAGDQGSFQDAPGRNRGRFKGNHNNANNNNPGIGQAGRGGLGSLGVRPGARAVPLPDGFTQVCAACRHGEKIVFLHVMCDTEKWGAS